MGIGFVYVSQSTGGTYINKKPIGLKMVIDMARKNIIVK